MSRRKARQVFQPLQSFYIHRIHKYSDPISRLHDELSELQTRHKHISFPAEKMRRQHAKPIPNGSKTGAGCLLLYQFFVIVCQKPDIPGRQTIIAERDMG